MGAGHGPCCLHDVLPETPEGREQRCAWGRDAAARSHPRCCHACRDERGGTIATSSDRVRSNRGKRRDRGRAATSEAYARTARATAAAPGAAAGGGARYWEPLPRHGAHRMEHQIRSPQRHCARRRGVAQGATARPKTVALDSGRRTYRQPHDTYRQLDLRARRPNGPASVRREGLRASDG